jgi:hypothetical protein
MRRCLWRLLFIGLFITPTANSTTAIRIDDRPAFFIPPQFLDVIYHADGNKEKCDLRRKTTGFPPRTLNRRKMGGLKVVRMGKIMLPEQILAVIVAV